MPKSVLSMAAAWASFDQQVMPPDAPPIQRQEMRRAFYAGAQAFLGFIMTGLDLGEEPTDADMDRMNGLAAELERFGEDVQAGRA